MQRNARSGEPNWASLAYVLWRHKHLTNVEIAKHLRSEGWRVRPAQVEAVICHRAGQELRASWDRKAGR